MDSSQDSLSRVRPYVSNLDRSVFAITGLPEEVIAVLFAYYSRSRDDLRTNLARLVRDEALGLDDSGAQRAPLHAQKKAQAFHEKWVVGYGHASVAEHAVVHLAVEDVSIVASKVIEDLRLGSYTEKSTRYVVFDTTSFADLPGLPSELHRIYQTSNERLFEAYLSLFPRLEDKLDAMVPRAADESDKARAGALRAHACDLLRGLLPAGTKTNLGITANARALGMLLSKMLSWPLDEVRDLAAQMRTEALAVAPTLVRHVAPSEHRTTMRELLTPQVSWADAPVTSSGSPVRLLRHDADALERIALALTYELSEQPDASTRLAHLTNMSRASLEALVQVSMQRRGSHDPAPRAFEASSITVELELDYGAYRDLQRHRMLAPFTQNLGCTLGASVPTELEGSGLDEAYRSALDAAGEAWAKLAQHDAFAAQYAVPLAYRVRTLWTLNLREVFHVVELRSSRQGHASYRGVAQELYRAVCEAHPWLSELIRVDLNDYRLARSR